MAGQMTRRQTGLQHGWEAPPLASFRVNGSALFELLQRFGSRSELAAPETTFLSQVSLLSPLLGAPGQIARTRRPLLQP